MTDITYDANQVGVILKRDVLGRVRSTGGQREVLLDVAPAALREFECSGLSGPQFAQVAGIKYQTFASWMQNRRRKIGAYAAAAEQPSGAGPVAAPRLQWMEAVLETGPACVTQHPTMLRVELPGGALFGVSDGAQVLLAAQLLKALQNPTPAR